MIAQQGLDGVPLDHHEHRHKASHVQKLYAVCGCRFHDRRDKIGHFYPMQLFYLPEVDAKLSTLDALESKHLVRVLRKKNGDVLHATDGNGHHLTCRLVDANPKAAVLEVTERIALPARPAALTLAVAPTKNMDRMEWLVEKATEIGIERIVPVLCEHSERKVIKHERLLRIATSAMKQSLRAHLPDIQPLTPLSEFVASCNAATRVVCHLDESNPGASFQSQLQPDHETAVLIGPEGDFSHEELILMDSYNFKKLNLGNRRLRAESAAMCAMLKICQILE